MFGNKLLDWLQTHQTPVLDIAMGLVTILGDGWMLLTVICLVHWWADRKLGLRLIIFVLICGILNLVLKQAFNIPRPAGSLAVKTGPSFPSGHAQMAAAFWLAIALAYRGRYSILGALVVAVLVAFSRVYFRAHWVADVIAGLLIGWCVAIAFQGVSNLCLVYPKSRNYLGLVGVATGLAGIWSAYSLSGGTWTHGTRDILFYSVGLIVSTVAWAYLFNKTSDSLPSLPLGKKILWSVFGLTVVAELYLRGMKSFPPISYYIVSVTAVTWIAWVYPVILDLFVLVKNTNIREASRISEK